MSSRAEIFKKIAAGIFCIFGILGNANAAGFVKNSSVSGYRVIVEGGGVEKRKEIQYDSEGHEIYNSEALDLKLLSGGGIDDELLGNGDFGESLELNLDPTANLGNDEKFEENDVPAPEKKTAGTPETSKKAAVPEAKKILRENDEIFIDPKTSLLTQPETADGRKMPFYISGEKKYGNAGDEDPSAGLTDFMKINDNFLAKKSDANTVEIEFSERYENIIGIEEWHSKFSSLGGKKIENFGGDSRFAQKRFLVDKNLDKKILENNLTWTRSRESHISTNANFAQKIAEKYTNFRSTKFSEMNLPAPGEGGISMQSINRYQFRRSHSAESGLETVAPGSAGTTKISTGNEKK